MLSASILIGCNIAEGLGDLDDSLLHPDPTSYDAPGMKITSGDFHSVQHVDNGLGKVTFVAQRTERDGEHLIVISADWGQVVSGKKGADEATSVCDAGPVTAVDPWGERYGTGDVDGINIWAFNDPDGDGYGKLRFLGRNCEEILPSIDDFEFASLEYIQGGANASYGYLGLTKQGQLYEFDVYGRTARVVAEGVDRFEQTEDELWTLERTLLRRRDPSTLAVEETVASQVLEFGATGSGFYYRTTSGLFLRTDGDWFLLSTTGCAPYPQGSTIVYLEPCENGHLMLLEADGSLSVGPEASARPIDISFGSIDYLPDPDRPGHWLLDPQHSVLTVNYFDELGAHDDLYRMRFEREAKSGPRTFVSQEKLGTHCRPWGGMTECNLVDGVGDLFRLGFQRYLDPPPQPWHQAVVDYFWFASPFRRVIADGYDGKTANLWISDDNDEVQLLSGVAGYRPNTPAFTTRAQADEVYDAYVVANSTDGISGDLVKVTFGPKASTVGKTLKKGVLAGFAFGLSTTEGYVYRSAKKKTLQAYLKASGLTVPIHDDVSEVLEIDSPSAGLVYVVDAGNDRGLWFSKQR